jgi:hypothetical protein
LSLTARPTLTTLVIGDTAAARENAILAALAEDAAGNVALILEGLPAGVISKDTLPALTVAHIAPGCVCCTGNLTMRVTLNRALRQSPQRLYIALATAMHLEAIRAFLTAEPYDKLLVLTQDLHA